MTYGGGGTPVGGASSLPRLLLGRSRQINIVAKAVMLLQVIIAPCNSFETPIERPNISQCNFCTVCSAQNSTLDRRRLLSERGGYQSSSEEVELISLDRTPGGDGDSPRAPEHPLPVRMQRPEMPAEANSTLKLPHPTVTLSGSPSAVLWNQYLYQADPRQGLGNCTQCTGCRHHVGHHDTQTIFMGQRFKKAPPRSTALEFKVTSRMTKSGVGVARFWCLPFSGKSGLDSCGSASPTDKDKENRAIIQENMAVHKLAGFCGLDNVLLPQWEEHITGVMPETGYAIDQPALVLEHVNGISLHDLSRTEDATFLVQALDSLKASQVLSAALFDLLFAQSNRQLHSVVVDKKGNLKLVENEKVLTGNTTNSLFLSRTAHQAHAIFGKAFVSSQGVQAMQAPSPLNSLDYRCHVEGGELGRNFPSQFKTCIRSIVAADVAKTMKEYGFPREGAVARLKERARKLLAIGLEKAIEELQPKSPSCRRFPAYEPCCKWKAPLAGGPALCADIAWRPSAWNNTLPCSLSNLHSSTRQQPGSVRREPTARDAVLRGFTESVSVERKRGGKPTDPSGPGKESSHGTRGLPPRGSRRISTPASAPAHAPRLRVVTRQGSRLKASVFKRKRGQGLKTAAPP